MKFTFILDCFGLDLLDLLRLLTVRRTSGFCLIDASIDSFIAQKNRKIDNSKTTNETNENEVKHRNQENWITMRQVFVLLIFIFFFLSVNDAI